MVKAEGQIVNRGKETSTTPALRSLLHRVFELGVQEFLSERQSLSALCGGKAALAACVVRQFLRRDGVVVEPEPNRWLWSRLDVC